MKYYIVAGEASGDLHGSNLIKALREKDAAAEFRFFGGDKMAEAAGTAPVKHYRELAYMGFVAVIQHAPSLLRNLSICRKDILAWHPDVLILIDYASFNLKIAAYIKKHCKSVPVHFYISPKIWVWKQWRIRYFKRDIDRLYIIFPFEKAFFAKHSYPVTYVGNPSVDSVEEFRKEWQRTPDAASRWLAQHGLESGKPVLAILPGSRRQEIKANLPLMTEAAKPYSDRFQIVVSGAPGIENGFYAPFTDNRIVFGETYALLSVAHTALVVSGTATLETALFKVPQVVCYSMPYGKTSTDLVRRFIIRTPFISLVNLVAGKEVVRELVSYGFTLESLSREMQKLLGTGTSDTEERIKMLQEYEEIAKTLGEPGAAHHTADAIVKAITQATSPCS